MFLPSSFIIGQFTLIFKLTKLNVNYWNIFIFIIYIKKNKITCFSIGTMSTMLSIEEMATSFIIES